LKSDGPPTFPRRWEQIAFAQSIERGIKKGQQLTESLMRNVNRTKGAGIGEEVDFYIRVARELL